MGLYYKLLLFAVIVLVCIKVTLQQVGIYRNLQNVKIANLFHLHGYRLNVTPLATEKFQNEMRCLTSCVKTNECFGLNIKKQLYDVLCELLRFTMYQYPMNLTRDESSSHWFAKVRHRLYVAWSLRVFVDKSYGRRSSKENNTEPCQPLINITFVPKWSHHEGQGHVPPGNFSSMMLFVKWRIVFCVVLLNAFGVVQVLTMVPEALK